MRCSGESAVIGSWNTMPIWPPRIARNSSIGKASRSRPWNNARPPSITAGGRASKRSRLSAVTVLPQPDSPTSPRTSPRRISNDTPSTARTNPAAVANPTRNSSTWSNASPMSAPLSDARAAVGKRFEVGGFRFGAVWWPR